MPAALSRTPQLQMDEGWRGGLLVEALFFSLPFYWLVVRRGGWHRSSSPWWNPDSNHWPCPPPGHTAPGAATRAGASPGAAATSAAAAAAASAAAAAAVAACAPLLLLSLLLRLIALWPKWVWLPDSAPAASAVSPPLP